MSDIRALLAQERQARRVQHPNASYSKSGVLSCNACHLNIKSESLWDGHLKSANHRKNVQKSKETAPKSLKRKIDTVEDAEQTAQVDDRGYEVDNRKKPKSTAQTNGDILNGGNEDTFATDNMPSAVPAKPVKAVRFAIEETESIPGPNIEQQDPPATTAPPPDQIPEAGIDEDEWAAFEADIAPLAAPDYSSATIVAAPVSAAQLKAEADADQKKLRDTEGEEEKEEESRRLEEEFDVMEEMEERVKKLRQKREALRIAGTNVMDTGQENTSVVPMEGIVTSDTIQRDEASSPHTHKKEVDEGQEEEDEDDEDVDDWYS
jgi:zinc finger protein 830